MPPVGQLAAQISAEPRFRRLAAIVHGKGARANIEAWAEAAARWNKLEEVRQLLERYAVLNDDDLQVTGSDQIPPAPLTPIDGGRH